MKGSMRYPSAVVNEKPVATEEKTATTGLGAQSSCCDHPLASADRGEFSSSRPQHYSSATAESSAGTHPRHALSVGSRACMRHSDERRSVDDERVEEKKEA